MKKTKFSKLVLIGPIVALIVGLNILSYNLGVKYADQKLRQENIDNEINKYKREFCDLISQEITNTNIINSELQHACIYALDVKL